MNDGPTYPIEDFTWFRIINVLQYKYNLKPGDIPTFFSIEGKTEVRRYEYIYFNETLYVFKDRDNETRMGVHIPYIPY